MPRATSARRAAAINRIAAALIVVSSAGDALAGDALAGDGPVVLRCTAFGGSHTSRMTFDFDPRKCRLYWREIAQVLPLDVCTADRLVAVKPYSPTVESLLHFDLATGRFVDQYGDVEDRGRCVAE